MLEALLNRLTGNKPRVFEIGGGWGNKIDWWGTNRVVGWKMPLPEVGDFLLAKMESGQVGRYRFDTVERCGDPKDMFFADVSWVEYEKR